MKFQLLLSLAVALFFSLFAVSLPISLFPNFGPPAVAKPNGTHTLPHDPPLLTPPENDLFLSRWQKNFPPRVTKPSVVPPILTLPTDILPAVKPTKPSLSVPADWDPRKLYDFPLDPEQPPVYPPVMHGALNFLKPEADDWRDWTPLSRDSAPSVGILVPEEEKKSFTPPMPMVLFEKKKPEALIEKKPEVLFEKKKPEILMPLNTVTKADLLRHIVELATDNSYCPECGEDVFEKKPGKYSSSRVLCNDRADGA